jgi:hypothetical protein
MTNRAVVEVPSARPTVQWLRSSSQMSEATRADNWISRRRSRRSTTKLQ